MRVEHFSRAVPQLSLDPHLDPLLQNGDVQVLPRNPDQAQRVQKQIQPHRPAEVLQPLAHPLRQGLHQQTQPGNRSRGERTHVQVGGATGGDGGHHSERGGGAAEEVALPVQGALPNRGVGGPVRG